MEWCRGDDETRAQRIAVVHHHVPMLLDWLHDIAAVFPGMYVYGGFAAETWMAHGATHVYNMADMDVKLPTEQSIETIMGVLKNVACTWKTPACVRPVTVHEVRALPMPEWDVDSVIQVTETVCLASRTTTKVTDYLGNKLYVMLAYRAQVWPIVEMRLESPHKPVTLFHSERWPWLAMERPDSRESIDALLSSYHHKIHQLTKERMAPEPRSSKLVWYQCRLRTLLHRIQHVAPTEYPASLQIWMQAVPPAGQGSMRSETAFWTLVHSEVQRFQNGSDSSTIGSESTEKETTKDTTSSETTASEPTVFEVGAVTVACTHLDMCRCKPCRQRRREAEEAKRLEKQAEAQAEMDRREAQRKRDQQQALLAVPAPTRTSTPVVKKESKSKRKAASSPVKEVDVDDVDVTSLNQLWFDMVAQEYDYRGFCQSLPRQNWIDRWKRYQTFDEPRIALVRDTQPGGRLRRLVDHLPQFKQEHQRQWLKVLLHLGKDEVDVLTFLNAYDECVKWFDYPLYLKTKDKRVWIHHIMNKHWEKKRMEGNPLLNAVEAIVCHPHDIMHLLPLPKKKFLFAILYQFLYMVLPVILHLNRELMASMVYKNVLIFLQHGPRLSNVLTVLHRFHATYCQNLFPPMKQMFRLMDAFRGADIFKDPTVRLGDYLFHEDVERDWFIKQLKMEQLFNPTQFVCWMLPKVQRTIIEVKKTYLESRGGVLKMKPEFVPMADILSEPGWWQWRFLDGSSIPVPDALQLMAYDEFVHEFNPDLTRSDFYSVCRDNDRYMYLNTTLDSTWEDLYRQYHPCTVPTLPARPRPEWVEPKVTYCPTPNVLCTFLDEAFSTTAGLDAVD